jgi:hypothetical protein
MPKLGFALNLQQDMIPLYRNDITFSYTNIFGEKKSLKINGQPTSLLVSLRYQLL